LEGNMAMSVVITLWQLQRWLNSEKLFTVGSLQKRVIVLLLETRYMQLQEGKKKKNLHNNTFKLCILSV
jgi:hypothetical protein